MSDGAPVVGGIVLAAGGGTRFGATKQLAPLRGRPLLSYALAAVGVLSPRVVVLGHEADAILAAVPLQGAQPVVCPDWASGQSASLRCGVEALGDVDAAVVVLGDQPRITAAAVAAVAAAAALASPPGAAPLGSAPSGAAPLPGPPTRATAARATAARATYGGRPGHPVLLGRALLDRVGELRGDVGFRDLLRGQDILDVEVGGLADPIDIDTQEELARL